MTRAGPRRRSAALILAVAASFACDSVPPVQPVAPPPGPEPGALWLAPFLSPASWARQRAPTNPVIHAGLDPRESLSAYNPAPIRLRNGDLLVYVKEDERRVITAYRSTDDGATFTLEGAGARRFRHLGLRQGTGPRRGVRPRDRRDPPLVQGNRSARPVE